MKNFMQRGFIQKLIISIVCCMIMLNFCITSTVQASFGGKLMGHLLDFAGGISDVVAEILQLGLTGKWMSATDKKGSGQVIEGKDYFIKDSKFEYPILQISPEVIFANQIQLTDANFISKIQGRSYRIKLDDDSVLDTLRNIIAGWYVTLRTIAIVGLLSVLIYIGIRIIISSTGQDKAKYKQRLVDWIVAFCLLFLMHYIMSALVTVVDKVNDVLGDAAGIDQGLQLPDGYAVKYTGGSVWDDRSKITNINSTVEQWFRDNGYENVKYWGTPSSGNIMEDGTLVGETLMFCDDNDVPVLAVVYRYGKDGNEKNLTFQTSGTWNPPGLFNNGTEWTSPYNIDIESLSNTVLGRTSGPDTYETGGDGSKVQYFTNYARLMMQTKDKDELVPKKAAYLIIYVALIVFTAVFTFRYIKRVIYIAFLTLMAPMVALTYPLDKIKDRKSTSMGYVV